MRLLFLLSILSISLFTAAQDQKEKKFLFQSINNLGFLEGSAGSAFQLQTINGFRYRSFSAGVGIGLDYYLSRSVPLFLDIRKDLFGGKRQTPFVYLSGGKHFPWIVNRNEWTEISQTSGWYYDAGIGYAIPVNTHAIIFSAGYSYKNYDEKVTSPDIMCLIGPCPEYQEKYSYQLRRISLKAGFRF